MNRLNRSAIRRTRFVLVLAYMALRHEAGMGAESRVGGGVVGTALKAVTKAAVIRNPVTVRNTTYRLHFDQKPRGTGLITNRSHWQINVFQRGVKGSGIQSFVTTRFSTIAGSI